VFVTSLLDLVERTADAHGEARITLTGSYSYKWARKLDYGHLTTAVPGDGTSLRHLSAGWQRYCDSKLAVLYLALQLDRQLETRGVKNVFVNVCQPGEVPGTDLGEGQQPLVSAFWGRALKRFLGLFLRNSTLDSAKTQVVLSASKRVGEEKVRGEFWAPIFSWLGYYQGSQKEELVTQLARDEEEWRKLWERCESAVAEYDARRTQ
jgi:NAD(P)-dependent dehydrogenase (short-subunit alcohol dehydrogenase family)